MQMPVFLILFFAPVYVPLGLLRGWIHAIATANPVTRLLEASRSLLAEAECPYQEARSAWYLGGEARREATVILDRLGATPLPD